MLVLYLTFNNVAILHFIGQVFLFLVGYTGYCRKGGEGVGVCSSAIFAWTHCWIWGTIVASHQRNRRLAGYVQHGQVTASGMDQEHIGLRGPHHNLTD